MVFLLAAPVDDPVEVRSAPALRVQLMPGRYAVSRHAAGTPVRPAPPAPRGLWSVTVTDDEVSYVTLESEAPADATAEPGWRALQVAGPLGFELVGVLSALTAVLADAAIPVFAVSTYDTDYLLVPHQHAERAADALSAAGHEIARGDG
jgi:hypothetical protein